MTLAASDLDGLPMPSDHYRATYCVDCTHIRAEHLNDRICFPRHGECDCTRFSRVEMIGVPSV